LSLIAKETLYSLVQLYKKLCS